MEKLIAVSCGKTVATAWRGGPFREPSRQGKPRAVALRGAFRDHQGSAQRDWCGAVGGDAPATRTEPSRYLSAGEEEGGMPHRMAWSVDLQRTEDGALLAAFPDIPEALTDGATEAEALAQARDCLIAALSGNIDEGAPSRARLRPASGRWWRRRCSPRPRSRSMSRCAPRVSATRRWPRGSA